MNSAIKCSIITVSYNSIKTILKNIQSVNKQTYNQIEHIFIDGNSSDGTVSLIKKYSRLKNIIISENDNGIYNAMNKGINASTGDVLVFLNSDDWFFNKYVIENVISYFDDDTDIVYGAIQYYNFVKKKMSWRKFNPGKYYDKGYFNGWHPPHPAFFIKKRSIKKFFDESLEISSDFDFMFYHQEVLKYNSKYIPQIITIMSTKGASGKLGGMIKGNLNIIKSLKKEYPNIFVMSYLIKRFVFKLASLK